MSALVRRNAEDILAVAQRLGARLKRITATELAGPCPRCGGRDRFSINTAKQIWNCRNCDTAGDDIALVRHVHGCGYHEALEFLGEESERPRRNPAPADFVDNVHEVRRKPSAETNVDNINSCKPLPPAAPGNVDDEHVSSRIRDAVALFRESIDPRGTIVERYFRSRHLELGDLAGRVIRWNPRIGAVVALFRNIATGEPQAVSRTFLDAEGRKLGRKFFGPTGGAAIMLDPYDGVTLGLHVGEGVETCQAARQLDLRPCWALGSAGAIASFPVLGGVETLTLLAEHDNASERAVAACAERWRAAGREVLINLPIGGKDLNDCIRSAA